MKKFIMMAMLAVFTLSVSAQTPVKSCDKCKCECTQKKACCDSTKVGCPTQKCDDKKPCCKDCKKKNCKDCKKNSKNCKKKCAKPCTEKCKK